MIYSMTGYGKASRRFGKMNVEVEVKSVNSRFLEVYVKTPQKLFKRELQLRDLVKDSIKRGKINLVIQIKSSSNGIDEIEIDEEKLKLFLSQIKKIKKTAKVKDDITLEHILQNKDILYSSSADIPDPEFENIKAVILSAIDSLQKMKKKEGTELAKDLKQRVKNIQKNLSLIEKEGKNSVSESYDKLKEKVKKLIDSSSYNDERMEMELAIMVERSDITEECVRLRSHIKFFIETINNDEEAGRKLNFICQEMNREANTIASKSLSTTITHNAVAMKEEIEKIREQIQNIE